MPNFQNNFGTNLTSNTTAGDTTSPLNSIPTVDAPYYIAFDATNANAHYEVVLVTSDTATNVNHAATTYNHTTAEEVRMVLPAVHLNTMQNFPEGFLINGKIVPSVASNNLTVALKTLAGTDPSATDPVYCRIGDTVRTVTNAVSCTANAASNWCNSGSAELATKEVDYFVYLAYGGGAVGIGFSRRPYFNLWNQTTDGAGSDNQWVYSNQVGGASFGSTEVMEVVGRFAATLSAGAGYTWSVPTFTASNLIQRPIYETRWLSIGSISSGVTLGAGSQTSYYQISGKKVNFAHGFILGAGGSATGTIVLTLPLAVVTRTGYFAGSYAAYGRDGGTATYMGISTLGNGDTTIGSIGVPSSNNAWDATHPFTWGNGDSVAISGTYEI